jgi:hypothetical protein
MKPITYSIPIASLLAVALLVGSSFIATALAQVLIPMIVLFFWGNGPVPGVRIGFGTNALFATLFVASALLFRGASANHV